MQCILRSTFKGVQVFNALSIVQLTKELSLPSGRLSTDPLPEFRSESSRFLPLLRSTGEMQILGTGHCMASGIDIYLQLLISTIRISDISNSVIDITI